MATGAVSGSPFFWKSWSPSQKFKHYWGLQDPRLQAIFESVQKLSLETFAQPASEQQPNSAADNLRLALAYCTDYLDPKLEASLKNIFEKATPEQLRNALTNLAQFCIAHCNMTLIETCERIISSCPMRPIADINAEIQIQKRIQEINKRRQPHSVSKEKQYHPSLSQRIIAATGNLRFAPVYVVSTVLVAYKLNFAEIPTGVWAAQSQITFFRTAFTDFQSLSESYLSLFSSRKKAVLVACIPISILLVGYYIFQYLREKYPEFFKSLVPEAFEKTLYKDLTEAARNGDIVPSIGRRDIRETIEANLSPPHGINPKAVILRGEPGVGKTQAMEDVAYRIMMKQTACLNRKKVISVNAIDLKGKGTWTDSNRHKTPIDELLETMQGKEEDYVLFVDEAHNLEEKAQEKLKTVLEKTNLCLVLATTSKEFQKTLAKNGPLLSRCDLPPELKALEAEFRASILKRIIQKYNQNPKHPIPINPDIVDTLITTIDRTPLPGSEPRKSKNILEGMIRWINAYTPEEPRLLTFLEQKRNNLNIKTDYKEIDDERVLFGDALIQDLDHLNLLESKIKIIEEHHQNRVKLFKERARLLQFKTKINTHLNELKRKIAFSTSPDDVLLLENRIIFVINFILKQIKNDISSLESKLKEGLAADKLNIQELVDAKLMTAQESKDNAMPKEEKILTTLTPEFIEEYINKLKTQSKTALGGQVGSEGSSTNVADAAGQPQPAVSGDESISRVPSSHSMEQFSAQTTKEVPQQNQRGGFSYKLELLRLLQQNNALLQQNTILIRTVLAARGIKHMGRSVSFEHPDEGPDSTHPDAPLNCLTGRNHPAAATGATLPGSGPLNPKQVLGATSSPTKDQ